MFLQRSLLLTAAVFWTFASTVEAQITFSPASFTFPSTGSNGAGHRFDIVSPSGITGGTASSPVSWVGVSFPGSCSSSNQIYGCIWVSPNTTGQSRSTQLAVTLSSGQQGTLTINQHGTAQGGLTLSPSTIAVPAGGGPGVYRFDVVSHPTANSGVIHAPVSWVDPYFPGNCSSGSQPYGCIWLAPNTGPARSTQVTLTLFSGEQGTITINQAGTIGAGEPSWVGDQFYDPGFSNPPTLTPGQGAIVYGHCLLRLTPAGVGHEYTGPMALNRNNRWMLVKEGGGHKIVRLGQRQETRNSSGALTGCSIDVGTPTSIPNAPAGLNTYHQWSYSEDYVAYFTTGAGRNSQVLWRVQCTANCESQNASWYWTQLREFTTSDIDWDNIAFCASNCSNPNPQTWVRRQDFAIVHLSLVALDIGNANRFIFSLRGGSPYDKSEYATCVYTAGVDTLHCRYVGQNGSLVSSATPYLASDSRGDGAIAVYNSTATSLLGFQFYIPSLNKALWYYAPNPNTAVGTWAGAYSASGPRPVGHAAFTQSGLCTVTGIWEVEGAWGLNPVDTNNADWVHSYTCYDLSATPPVAGQPAPLRRVLYFPESRFELGVHASSSPNPARSKWHALTFYKENARGAQGTLGREIVMVDTSRAGLPLPPTSKSTPLPAGSIVRLGPHYSWCFSGSKCTYYDNQGHGNLSWNGDMVVFKSNMQGGITPGNPAAPHSVYAYVWDWR